MITYEYLSRLSTNSELQPAFVSFMGLLQTVLVRLVETLHKLDSDLTPCPAWL